MPKFIRKWPATILGLLLCLAAAPAFAGKWVKGVTDREGWNAIAYKGNFNEGEFARLFYYTRGKYSRGKTFTNDSRKQVYRLIMLLNDGDVAITGFTGVALVSKNSNRTFKDQLILSQGPHRNGFGHLAGSYDLGAHSGKVVNLNDISAWHACFPRRPSKIDRTLAVPCDSGKARWIYVEVRGSLKEEYRQVRAPSNMTPEEMLRKAVEDTAKGYASGRREFYSPGPAIRASTSLFVGVQHGKKRWDTLAIDETFRQALWDEKFWKKQ